MREFERKLKDEAEKYKKKAYKNTCRGKGKDNIRWNNGASEYLNHAELKKMRIKVLIRDKNKCIICGKPAEIIHHIDGSKNNHSMDNLIAVCRKCHEIIHCDDEGKSLKGRPTKYGMMYGMTLKEMAKRFGVSYATIYNWLQNPDKKKWVEKELKK